MGGSNASLSSSPKLAGGVKRRRSTTETKRTETQIVRQHHGDLPRRVVPLAVAPQRVGLLPVRRVVPYHELVVGHPERREPGDGQQNGRGGDEVPPDDEEGAHQLFDELEEAAAVSGALGARHREDEAAQCGLGEEAGEEAAKDSGDGVGVEDCEGVVHLLEQCGFLVEDHHGEPRDDAR
ncbi:hypothetical protein C4D60_Mb04t20060 [Musa balbisiana]|uniref:Uncharacterized protein n=1 Tax=Musa balbisiana TaxID=52838 RepID=A0A4S8KDD5_MUSBA|nr:hypothetical protein C4D60_Mb04t20060 [Musa balbisiana]